MPRTKKTEEKIEKKVATRSLAKLKDPNNPDPSVDKKEVKKPTKLTAEIFDSIGKVADKITLPQEIFGRKINKAVIAQAVRVYQANQRLGTASTKTRGEVEGSTRKIYRQKGTGRARHGGVRAPIFVHGGIVFGPKPRDYSLHLPQKMKRAALFSALSAKFQSGEIKVLQGIEKIEPKTRNFINIISKLGINNKNRKILLITPSEIENLKRAARNVEGVTITTAKRLSTYDVLNNRHLLFMKEAVEELKKHFLDKTKKLNIKK